MPMSRRSFTLALIALPGCSPLGLLSPTGTPRDIFELQPINLTTQGRRSSGSLLVVMPSAPAAITTDRILIKQNPLSVTYLPNATWADAVPNMLQSILIRSLASSGQIGFVGAQGAGPVPDTVLLTRIDAFEVTQQPNGRFEAYVSLELTVLRDRDQRVLGTRRFAQKLNLTDDQASTIARAFQQLLDTLLPEALVWVLSRVG